VGQRQSKKKVIALVVPVYCESGSITEFYSVLTSVVGELKDYSFKIIFVDDGSTDNSVELIEQLIFSDPRLSVIKFLRNFGKEAALTAGVLESLPYDAVITIDADLQHPPTLIPELIKNWEKGSLVVATIRNSIRSHSWVRKISSDFYYFLIRGLGGSNIISKATDFRLMDEAVIRQFSLFDEKIHMFRSSIDWFGFKTAYISFDAPGRFDGNARYSYQKLISLAVDSITAFSLLPLKITGMIGVSISILSALMLSTSLVLNIMHQDWFVSALALVVLFNTFLVGILMICLGLIALYIGSIHQEVVKRPRYIIK
jgi:polyisoprenyl-phosphate glycosyltransferase